MGRRADFEADFEALTSSSEAATGGMASESDAEELGELEEEDYTVLRGLLCCLVLIALMIMH